MIKYYILLIVLFFFSCKKTNEVIPSYITINDIILNENNTSNITDAWVYVNDNIIGVYELPAKLPILTEGKQKITIRAGIKSNGIAATRTPYPFYSFFIDSINFIKDSSVVIVPSVQYLANIDWNNIFVEDFTFGSSGIKFVGELENQITFSDTTLYDSIISDNRTCGYIELNDSTSAFRTKTLVLPGQPQNSEHVFLEMDYRCDSSSIIVGMYKNDSRFDIMSIFPKQEWNKIYIDLTPIINSGGSVFEVFLESIKPEDVNTTTLYIDNFRIIYL